MNVETSPQKTVGPLSLLALLRRNWKLLVGAPLVASILTTGLVFVLPKWYLATTQIMPPQQAQSNTAAFLGQLGMYVGNFAGQALGIKNPSDLYVAMLKSRTVADALIKRFDLLVIYDKETFTETRKELSRNSSITANRDGTITIDVEDRDPRRAAEIANAYVEELEKLTSKLAVSEAAQRRLFLEGQLGKAKEELASAELDLKGFSQKARLVNPSGQLSLSMAAAASLRAQITAKEIQLSAMRTYATADNPELNMAAQELRELKVELGKLERRGSAPEVGDVLVPFDNAQDVSLEYVRRLREVKYHEALFEILAKQYEIARIDEARDSTLVQVLDRALPPERKSKPRRLLIIVLTTLAAAVGTLIFVLLRESFGESVRSYTTP